MREDTAKVDSIVVSETLQYTLLSQQLWGFTVYHKATYQGHSFLDAAVNRIVELEKFTKGFSYRPKITDFKGY